MEAHPTAVLLSYHIIVPESAKLIRVTLPFGHKALQRFVRQSQSAAYVFSKVGTYRLHFIVSLE